MVGEEEERKGQSLKGGNSARPFIPSHFLLLFRWYTRLELKVASAFNFTAIQTRSSPWFQGTLTPSRLVDGSYNGESNRADVNLSAGVLVTGFSFCVSFLSIQNP